MESAIALARSSVGTLLRRTAFTGEVERKSASSHRKARAKKPVGEGARKQAAATGAASALLMAQTRRPIRAAGVVVPPALLAARDPAIGPPPADDRPEAPGEDQDDAERPRSLLEREAVAAKEERRRPVPEAADGERLRRVAEDTAPVEADAPQLRRRRAPVEPARG